ncbi:protein kinase subdomain-containing protein PKL/CAK/Fmp29 [Phlebopus sp. FC_14]|nr:protein kinase subdomain-containing protein PKL/CAK/Fmp29 [Phlebopus sp. FC_14]
MPCLGSARLVFNLLTAHSFTASLSTTTRLVPRRAFSVANSHNDLFDYTSGCWVFNDALRHAERRLVFDVEGLCRLAAQSVDRNPADVVDIKKLAEGGFNRSFLITLCDDFQMVARIPYPATVPKYNAVASEVATMDFLRSSGLPTPKVYGYSPESDNAAGTEYIFMEFVRGTKLSDVWLSLGEQEVISVLRQLTQLESKMMSLSFPAGGSLYYTQDLEKVARGLGIPLEDERFCVGPDTRLPLWYGRRSQLDVDRGPYESAEAALVAAARKELAYLAHFGQPLLPFRRERRDGYQYQEQSPSAHIENLNRYLLIASSLVPRDPALGHFCIRHPDLQQGNIIVSRSPDSDWQVVSLLDWQHASILPPFLLAGVPQRLQNYDDPISQSMTPPSLPENFDELDGTQRTKAEEVYLRRVVHYHYVTNTEECNTLHYAALTDPINPWEGETLELKVALIQATERWEMLTGGGAPCPVVFDAEDVRETMELNEVQRRADEALEVWQNMLGLGPEGWVPTQHYEEAVALSKQMKEKGLAEERAEIMGHWPWDDMDEGKYM